MTEEIIKYDSTPNAFMKFFKERIDSFFKERGVEYSFSISPFCESGSPIGFYFRVDDIYISIIHSFVWVGDAGSIDAGEGLSWQKEYQIGAKGFESEELIWRELKKDLAFILWSEDEEGKRLFYQKYKYQSPIGLSGFLRELFLDALRFFKK